MGVLCKLESCANWHFALRYIANNLANLIGELTGIEGVVDGKVMEFVCIYFMQRAMVGSVFVCVRARVCVCVCVYVCSY